MTKYLDYAGLSKVVAYLKNYISVGDGLKAISTSTGKQLSVKYDGETIVLNSAGELVTTITGDNAAAKLSLTVDSEFTLLGQLLNFNDSEISASSVSLPLEALIIDGRYVEDSEGEWLLLTLKNYKTIKIPVDAIIEGFVTVNTDQDNIRGDKNFKDDLKYKGYEVLNTNNVDNKSVKFGTNKKLMVNTDDKTIIIDSNNKVAANIDNKSIVLNSEGKLSTVAKKLSAVEPIFIDTSDNINLLFDNDTLKLDSENRLYVSGKLTSEGTKEVVKEITKQSETITKNSEGAIEIRTEKVTEKIVEKSETVIVNSEGGIEVKIDNDTIVLNSEGELCTSTKAQRLSAVKPIIIDSENKITLSYASPLCVDTDDKLSVSVDDMTIVCNVSEGYLEVPTQDIILGKGLILDSEYNLTVLIDDSSIKIDSEGRLYSTTNLDSEGIVRLKKQLVYGSNTITVDSENVIEVITHEMYIGEGLDLSSEGILSVFYDNKTLALNNNYQLSVNVDDRTLVYNSENYYLEVPTEDMVLGDGLEISSEGYLRVLIDGSSIKVDSEGRIYATTNLDSEGVVALKKQLVQGSNTIAVTSENILEVVSHPLYIGEGLDLSSEGILWVLVDNNTIKINDDGELYSTASFDSEGIKTLKTELVKDSTTLTLSPEGSMEVNYDDETIVVGVDGKLALPIDDNKVFINSEGYLDTAPTTIDSAELTSIIEKVMSGI